MAFDNILQKVLGLPDNPSALDVKQNMAYRQGLSQMPVRRDNKVGGLAKILGELALDVRGGMLQDQFQDTQKQKVAATRQALLDAVGSGTQGGTFNMGNYLRVLSQNPNIDINQALTTAKTFQDLTKTPKRETIEQDGVHYFKDSGEKVLPNVAVKPKDREMFKAADGYMYYKDDKTRVLPNVVKDSKSGTKGGGLLDFTKVGSTRKEIRKLEEPYRDAVVNYRDITGDLSQRNAHSDMAAIFELFKMLDPTSTVREGEYATAKNAGSVPVWLQNSYNAAVDGVLLTEQQRKDVSDLALRRVSGLKSLVSEDRGWYTDQLTSLGYNPENFIQPLPELSEEELKGFQIDPERASKELSHTDDTPLTTKALNLIGLGGKSKDKTPATPSVPGMPDFENMSDEELEAYILQGAQ